MWWIIVAAVIALVVAIFLIFGFQGSGGKGFRVISENIEGLADCDKDRVVDIYDKCKYDQAIGDEFPEGTTACGPQTECLT